MKPQERIVSVWKLGRFFLAAILLTAGTLMPGFALAAPLETASAGVSSSNSIGGCDPPGGSGTSAGPGPISFHIFCSDTFGTASATGTASIGHAGATAVAATFDPFSGFASSPGASALYSDTVIFHATDNTSAFPDGIPVSLNLGFSGTISSTLEAGAVVGVLVQINGVTVSSLHATNDNGLDTSCSSSFLGGEGCATATDSNVTTQATDGVPLDTPVSFLLSVEVSAGSVGAATASAEYGRSLDLSVGIDVFNLPEGVTANAPDSNIVDNRFLLPTQAVPEPSTWALMLLSVAGLGFAYRGRRRPKAKTAIAFGASI
jgi:hypothetical protein